MKTKPYNTLVCKAYFITSTNAPLTSILALFTLHMRSRKATFPRKTTPSTSENYISDHLSLLPPWSSGIERGELILSALVRRPIARTCSRVNHTEMFSRIPRSEAAERHLRGRFGIPRISEKVITAGIVLSLH